jgi:type II secretory pathway pseudopilin PulG
VEKIIAASNPHFNGLSVTIEGKDMAMRSPPPNLRTSGVTIVETLVVCAIVAALVALLFPVLQLAKRGGKSATCTSNLRQIGIATVAYQGDHDGHLPWVNPRQHLTYAHQSTKIDDPLGRYGTIDALYRCPDGDGPAKLHPGLTDFQFRFGLDLTSDTQVRFVGIEPEPSSVIVYCDRHRHDPKYALHDGKGGGLANGALIALAADGSVRRVASGTVRLHEENWGGFPPEVEPHSYRWVEFPGETFPPVLRGAWQP